MVTKSKYLRKVSKYLLFISCLIFSSRYIYFCLLNYSILYKEFNLEKEYYNESNNTLHRYDNIRRRNLRHGLKISSSSYHDNILDEDYEYVNKSSNKVNAVLLMLVRNWELPYALKSMRSLEDRFNHDYQYDWVFLNDVPFDDAFIEATTLMASGETKYALIPSSDWDKPDWIDDDYFEERLNEMERQNIIYGNSKSYRNMCRFNSGFFFRQKILNQYDYYFRVEPDVEYFCDFPYDPFQVMSQQKKKYGFVMTLVEYESTIPTLWKTVRDYIKQDKKQTIDTDSELYQFITDWNDIRTPRSRVESTDRYNMCHFWSNFEIGDLNFFRSDEYIRFFDYLDSSGGFYYERWGDAPVHSIAAMLLLKESEIIHFDEIGYLHAPYFTIPQSNYFQLKHRCICDQLEESRIDFSGISCLTRWWKHGPGKKFMRETYQL
ncbi:similar to Saccharomyces cerevisiae YKR061W KTR2 Mannosyltransferase involved in N-linked protein glycosylation [Maudiozyma saulgeensis]|uniref:Similar to Saccharomyces cerevisiae YKR061W KTR2 Mannosyltransferase involved in N-linked protein glycosylation n=1 Tax=Maudiozyma saulgeensis TaxID=1789683 RepID=A0A1X7R102_9SACH|nr:similar to Saccharomyces cerevisiae YKR061W KTR2 Mannosyltransferase involved in N-linked protein glycosylation [Kazachstania saulgeensis]